jgi:hypothetical protein
MAAGRTAAAGNLDVQQHLVDLDTSAMAQQLSVARRKHPFTRPEVTLVVDTCEHV